MTTTKNKTGRTGGRSLQLSAQEVARKKSIVIDLAIQARALTKKDIESWRQAWQMAINPENPSRQRLYSIYEDVLVDLHLTGCIGQRKNMVAKKAFKLIGLKDKKENPEITEIFEAEWFKDFMDYALDSRYWGHSLMQFGDILTVNGKQKFESVELIPRLHVIPEYGVITREPGQEWRSGISYRDGKLAQWCIESGRPDNLGLLLKCAPQAISKKNMLAFWDMFGEIFGMPVRIGKTATRDNRERGKIERMLEDMGAAAWGLFPEGTEIEIKETSRGDAFNVYDKRIDRANSEMSKGVLNQTMTIDSGSSLSQSEVHLEIFQNVIESDADMVRDLTNNRLIPFMLMHGFPLDGYRFDWDESVEYTPEQQIRIDELALTHFEVDPKYIQEKYNIPVTAKKEKAPFFD